MANVDVWAGFMIFHDDYDRLRFLPGDQKLKVLDAVCEFSKSGEIVDMGEPMMNIVYDILTKAVTRARAKSINAKKGHSNKGAGRVDADADSAKSCNDLQLPAHFCNDLHTSGDACAPVQHKDKGKPDYKSDAKSGTNPDATAPDGMQTDTSVVAQARVIRYCQSNGVNLTFRHYEEIGDFLEDGITDEMMMLAVDIAVENGAKGWGYAKTIITKWRDNGVNTIEAARLEQAAFKAKKGAPASQPMYSPMMTRVEELLNDD